MTGMLIVDRVSVAFGNLKAVDDVSFRVDQGDRLALIGPNGAGKTTLLNVIGGQHPGTHGRVTYRGRNLTRLSPDRRARLGIARSFQVPSVFRDLHVAENVWLALACHDRPRLGLRLSRARARTLDDAVGAALDAWSLIAEGETPAGQLSHGQQRRLELCLALGSDPGLVLLDEPTAGLTKDERLLLVATINALPSSVSVLVIDHDIDSVFAMARRVIVMHRGRIVADGTPAEMRTDSAVARAYGLPGA